jgi:hypothetical protein
MYFTIRGHVDSFEDTSYQRTVNKGKADQHDETVQRFQLTLTVPGMQENVKVDISPDRIENMPPSKTFDTWEMDETWVVVTADAMRTAKGDTDGRAWAIVTFSAVKVEEMNAQERQALVEARRKVKTARKAKATEARKAKAAAKQAPAA